MWTSVTIPGFEHYIVSEKAEIINTRLLKMVKGWHNKNGYNAIELRDKHNRSHQYVHRLVALAFIPNDDPENKTEVNHKDRNRANNERSNLEWVTKQYNLEYRWNFEEKIYVEHEVKPEDIPVEDSDIREILERNLEKDLPF